MDQTPLVVKSNALIDTSYRLTVNEQKIILACISQVRRDEPITDEIMYSVSSEEFSSLCGVSTKHAFQELKNSALQLRRREVRVTLEPNSNRKRQETLVTGWVQSITFSKDSGTVKLRFSRDILSYLTELKGFHTSYRLSGVIRMSSTYGVRIYEMLAQWKSLGEREITIDHLRKNLQLEEKYKTMCNFKARVLDPAMKDINKNSDIWAKVTQSKTGRKVTHLKFEFGLKDEHKAKKNNQENLSTSRVLGIDKAIIEKKARAGETYEQAAIRIKRERTKELA